MPALTTTYEKGKIFQLDPNLLKTDPGQPRKYMDPQAMEEMTASVIKHGILQPILFRSDESGNPVIVAGERRVEAAKKAGLATIPAIPVDGNHAEIALVENLLRQDLTPVEEAEALDRLLKDQNYTHEQLAGIIGKARNTLTEILSLNRLPLEIRDECRSSNATARKTLIEIARKKQERGMITAWNHYKDKLAREAEGRKKREKVPENVTDIIKWVNRTISKLDNLDTTYWPEDEKNALNQALMNLNESVQAILHPPEEPEKFV